MKDITTALMQQFRREHKAARRYMALLLALALLTSLFVNWQLHSVGIAQTADYQCGEIEHQHTAECYEKVLVCGYEEGEPEDWNATKPDDSAFPDADYGVEQSEADIAAYSAEPEPEYIFVPHQHTDDCYQEVKTLTCYEEEHVHTDDCFDPEDGSLICDLFEHTHDDSCYTTEYELVCGLEEGELVEEPNPDYVPVDEEAFAVFDDAVALQPVVDDSSLDTPVHHHTDACYEEVLVCGLPEHHHTVNCLSDPLADVEDEETWSAKTNVSLTGAWADDLTAVAKSQLGYQQSERNFKLDDEDQTTVRHYTRYGAWYGNAYGAWDVMFLSYCLNYANVPQTTVPQRAGVQALRSDLRGSEWLKAAAEVELVPGDIVFYNSITTETVAVEEDAPQIMDDSADADIALLSLEPVAAEPQTEERTVSTETVGIVSDVDADAGTLTVISCDVDGKVAEVSLRADEITDVIDLAAAHKAQEEEDKREYIDGVEPAEDAGTSLVIWAIDPASLASPYAVALLADEGTSTTKNDLGKYLNKVTFRKNVNGNWQNISSTESVEDGDTINLILEFNLPRGTLTGANNTITYKLPNGLKLKEAIIDYDIVDASNSDKPVGKYTIRTDGTVVMTFTDLGSVGDALDGKLTFEAEADYQSAPNGTIDFGNHTTTLNVTEKKPEQPDLSVDKGLEYYNGNGKRTWSNDKGDYYAYWKVTVSSKNGSGGTVHLCDTLDTQKGFPAKHTKDIPIKLIKYNANGTTTEINTTEYPYTISTDGAVLEFKDLPELKKGEKYVLYYATKAAAEDLKAMYGTNTPNIMYNTATAETEKVQKVSSDKKYITYNKTIIEKKGKPNADGLIEWTVVVRAPLDGSTGFLKDYTFQDVLPDNINLSSNINVQIEGAQTTNATITKEQMKAGVQLSTLDENAKTAFRFTITYKTTVPTDGATSVTNVASLDNKLSAEKTVPISQGVWNLTKTHNRTENDIAYWNLNAVNVTGASQFDLTDTIGDTTDDSGVVLRDKHYAIASELQNAIEKGLTLTLTNNRTLNYEQAKDYLNITYLDAFGQQVDAKNTTAHVLSFTVAVKTAEDITVRQMVLKDVPTHEERSGKPEGADWTFTNNAKIMQGGNAKANDSARDVYLTSVFEKKVSIDGRNTYLTEDNKVNYDEIKDQTLMYSIKLVTTGTETGEIVIEDTLPEGVVFDNTNAANKFKLYVDNVQRAWYNGNWTLKVQERYLKIEVGGCDDGKQHVIEFQYEVKLDMTNDSRWKDLLTSDVPYKNSAIGGGKKDSITLTVHKDLPSLIKTGEQIWDSVNNKWSDKVTYKVIINPTGKPLGNGGPLELLDKMQVSNGANFYGENVQLYEYVKDTAVENLRKVEPGRYSASINDPTKEGWLYMTIPDSTALLLTYDCVIDPGNAVSPTLSNIVSLNGKISGSSDGLQFQTNSSSAQITRGQLIIYKVDAETPTRLKGAEFTLSRYDPKLGFTEGLTSRTNENGELIFGITKNGPKTLNENVLYRLTETKAPTNYNLDSTPKYLFFYEKDANPKEAFKTALGDTPIKDIDNNKNVTVDDVIFGCSTNTTQLTVKNTYNRLTVQKYWLNASNNQTANEADIPQKSIRVQLYRHKAGQPPEAYEAYGTPVELSKTNNWSHTWEGTAIPAKDEKGEDWFYSVKELDTGLWKTTYSPNNDTDIQKGSIYITNTIYSSYELPSTGGMGTVPFAAVGGMLTVGAALLLAKRKKHEEKGE